MLTNFLTVILGAGAAILALWIMFLFVLAFFSLWGRRKKREIPHRGTHRIAVIIPAHNEENLVAKTVNSVKASCYPEHLFKVFVIADNCDDRTAGEAEKAGATCIVRSDDRHRNKGYALKYGLDVIARTEEPFDAFLFIDADTLLAPDFLLRMSMDLAAGHELVQGRYSISEPKPTWLTRLTSLGFILKNYFQFPALNLLGMSMPLRGSGMCFHHSIIDEYGWGSTVVGEDEDFAMQLIYAGKRIHFDFNAVNWQYMPSTLHSATTQRTRWSTGKTIVKKNHFERFLIKSLRDADPILFLQTLYLFSPPLSSYLLASGSLTVASLVLFAIDPSIGFLLPVFCISVSVAYAGYFLLALTVTGFDAGYTKALVMIPFYALWRIYAHIQGYILVKQNRTGWLALKKK